MACATDFYRCSCGAVVKCRTTCTQCLPAKRADAEERARAEFAARKEQAEREQRALEERKREEARAVTQALAGRPVPIGYPFGHNFNDIVQRMNAAFVMATSPELSNDVRDDAVRSYCVALRERLTAEGISPQQQDGIVAKHTQLIIRQLQASRVSKGLNDAREARGMNRLDKLADKALNEYERLFPERAQQANQGAWVERAWRANQDALAAMARPQQAQADLAMQITSSSSNHGGQGMAEAERRARSGQGA